MDRSRNGKGNSQKWRCEETWAARYGVSFVKGRLETFRLREVCGGRRYAVSQKKRPRMEDLPSTTLVQNQLAF